MSREIRQVFDSGIEMKLLKSKCIDWRKNAAQAWIEDEIRII